jgi:hypothetical protein
MLALENPAAAEELVREAWDYLQSLDPRSGIHVSDLVNCRRQGWYQRNGYIAAPHSTQTLLLFLMGQGHHSLLEAGAKEIRMRVDVDGIELIGTVDHMEEIGTPDEFPGEIKTTRASMGKMTIPSTNYIEQAASYAVMKGANHARIYVIFLLGDYKGAKLPAIKAWDLEFTDLELRNWRREMGRRAAVLAGPTVPSLAEHRGWECDRCPFHERAGGPCPGSEGTDYQWFPNVTPKLKVREEAA